MCGQRAAATQKAAEQKDRAGSSDGQRHQHGPRELGRIAGWATRSEGPRELVAQVRREG